MQLNAVKGLNADIQTNLDELSKYLVAQTIQNLKNIKTIRLWEKSLPLWTAVFFAQRAVPSWLMSGNHGLKTTSDVQKNLPPDIQDDILVLREKAEKQKRSAHADFTILDPSTKDHGKELGAELMIEFKCAASYLKSEMRIKSLFADILVFGEKVAREG